MSNSAWKWAAIAALLVGAACQKSGKVSVSAQAVTPAATDGGATAGPLDLGQGILVDRVRLAVRKVALEGAQAEAAADAGSAPDAGTDMGMSSSGLVADHGGDNGGGSGGDDNGQGDDAEEGEVSVGPFTIDLTGDQMKAGITQVFDGDVPPGTYHELKIVIAPLSGSNSGPGSNSTSDGGTSAPADALNGQTVIVDGTVDGKTFSFQAIFHATQKSESTITVTAGGTSSNVTLKIDPTGWFKAADGSRLDPSDTSAATAAAIVDNIRASIRAFDDDDRDGQEDDHGGSSGGGGHN